MAFELICIPKDIEIIGFHSLYYFEFGKHFYHAPETHDFWELVYVDSGRINSITDGIGCTLNQGQVIFHKPLELHAHVANRKDPSNLVVVSFSCKGELMNFFNKKIFDLDERSQKILSLFLLEAKNALGELPSQYEDQSPLDFNHAKVGSPQLMAGYLIEFLFSLIRRGDDSFVSLRQTRDSRELAEHSLSKAMETCLKDHLYQPLSLAELSSHFLLSKTYLCRIFKEGTGKSPIDYHLDLKIEEAKRLIRKEGENVTQIAEKLGFSSIHHFTRTFKARCGLSPLAYKKSVRG